MTALNHVKTLGPLFLVQVIEIAGVMMTAFTCWLMTRPQES